MARHLSLAAVWFGALLVSSAAAESFATGELNELQEYIRIKKMRDRLIPLTPELRADFITRRAAVLERLDNASALVDEYQAAREAVVNESMTEIEELFLQGETARAEEFTAARQRWISTTDSLFGDESGDHILPNPIALDYYWKGPWNPLAVSWAKGFLEDSLSRALSSQISEADTTVLGFASALVEGWVPILEQVLENYEAFETTVHPPPPPAPKRPDIVVHGGQTPGANTPKPSFDPYDVAKQEAAKNRVPEFEVTADTRTGDTVFTFTTKQSGFCQVAIYGSTDERLRAHVYQGNFDAGKHAVTWNGNDDGGSPLPAGEYIVAYGAQLSGRLTPWDNIQHKFYHPVPGTAHDNGPSGRDLLDAWSASTGANPKKIAKDLWKAFKHMPGSYKPRRYDCEDVVATFGVAVPLSGRELMELEMEYGRQSGGRDLARDLMAFSDCESQLHLNVFFANR